MTTLQQQFEALVAKCISDNKIPAMAAAFVHDYGAATAFTTKGVRRWDKPALAQASDIFNLGSISKPVTGYLMATLIQAGLPTPSGPLTWGFNIRQAFPELESADCRHKFGIPDSWAGSTLTIDNYLNVTIEELLSQGSGMFDEDNEMSQTGRGDPPGAPEDWFQGNPGTLLAEWSTANACSYRRFLYAIQALQAAPIFPAGQGKGYGGSPMICAAMIERLTGKTYEQLIAQYLFSPAGMTQSKIGRTATSDSPDGVFEHDANHKPIEAFTGLQVDFDANSPAGGFGCSSRDLAILIQQNLPSNNGAHKRVLTDANLQIAQAPFNKHNPSNPVSRSALMAYPSNERYHNGENGGNYAEIHLYPEKGYGVAAVATLDNTVSAKPLQALLSELESWEANWSSMFGG